MGFFFPLDRLKSLYFFLKASLIREVFSSRGAKSHWLAVCGPGLADSMAAPNTARALPTGPPLSASHQEIRASLESLPRACRPSLPHQAHIPSSKATYPHSLSQGSAASATAMSPEVGQELCDCSMPGPPCPSPPPQAVGLVQQPWAPAAGWTVLPLGQGVGVLAPGACWVRMGY